MTASTGWTLEPLQLGLIGAGAAAYASLLPRWRQPSWRLACLGGALAALVAAVASPLASLGEHDLFSAHMGAHLLLGDLAALLAVLGLEPSLRPGRRTHPLAAAAVWAAPGYAWHVPAVYDAALGRGWVHALQHLTFFAAGLLLWSSLLQPFGDGRTGTGTRLAAVAAMQVLMTALGMVFVWSPRVFYDRYEHTGRVLGLTSLDDQRLGGIVMLAEGGLVLLGAFGWLVLRGLVHAEAAGGRPAAPTS